MALAGGLLLAGCGGGSDDATSAGTTTTTAPVRTVAGRVYFLHGGKVWPVARQLETPGVAASALAELSIGPHPTERKALKLTSMLPDRAQAPGVTVTDGVATVELESQPTDAALAQVIYTLTQFPTVQAVEIDGKRYTRADFEGETPAILVESPLAFQTVSSPLRARGTANTFEANFEYELTDTDGKIVDSHFVTATSGTGTRGTFDFTTKPFVVPFAGIGSLIVFELSAKDGARIHLMEIPLRMEK